MEVVINGFNKKYGFYHLPHLKILFVGLPEDVKMLSDMFLSKNDLSFCGFANVWKETQFASIFRFQTDVLGLMEFTQGVLHFSKGFMFGTSLELSIFGVYLIYAVYYKGTTIRCPRVRLRLTQEEVKSCYKLVELFQAKGHYDPINILLALINNDAVHFTVEPFEAGLEMGFKKYFNTHQQETTPSFSRNTPFDISLLDSFETISKIYESKKLQRYDKKDVFFEGSDFLTRTRNELNQLNKGESTTKSEPLPSTSSETGLRRQRLKMNAFEKRVAPKLEMPSTSRAEHISEDEMDVDDPEEML